MREDLYILIATLLCGFQNRIFMVQAEAEQLKFVEVRREPESQDEQNVATSIEIAIPVDLVNLQMTFKIIQKSLRGLQIILETIKTRQTAMHLSLLNITRSLKTPSYVMWKVLKDEKSFITDIRDVQLDITKMNRFISNWETELDIPESEQLNVHDKFSKRAMKVIKEVEQVAQAIMRKVKKGQQILKHDIKKMKNHVDGLKSEIKKLLENLKNLKESTDKRETRGTETIMEKGESVVQIGKKLQQIKANVESVKTNVGHIRSEVRATYLMTKMKLNLGNIAQNLSKMIVELGDLNVEQLKIEFGSDIDYPGKGILPVKIDKLHKEVDNSIKIALAIGNKFSVLQEYYTKRAEHLEEIGDKLIFLSKNILEMEAKLEVIANTILENGQLLLRDDKFTEGIKIRFHIQGEILKNLASSLENIGENFEQIGQTIRDLGTILTEVNEQKLGNVGDRLIEYAIK